VANGCQLIPFCVAVCLGQLTAGHKTREETA
jgi:hypothetical protein